MRRGCVTQKRGPISSLQANDSADAATRNGRTSPTQPGPRHSRPPGTKATALGSLAHSCTRTRIGVTCCQTRADFIPINPVSSAGPLLKPPKFHACDSVWGHNEPTTCTQIDGSTVRLSLFVHQETRPKALLFSTRSHRDSRQTRPEYDGALWIFLFFNLLFFFYWINTSMSSCL